MGSTPLSTHETIDSTRGALAAPGTQTHISYRKKSSLFIPPCPLPPCPSWEVHGRAASGRLGTPQLGPLELRPRCSCQQSDRLACEAQPLSRRVVLRPLSRCRKWVHDCPCTGLGSAGAAGGGSASAWGGKGVAAQTQTQAPACLQERDGHGVDAASLSSLPYAKLRPPSHPPKEHASRWSSPDRCFSLAGQQRSVSSGQSPAPAHSALTQKLVEDVGDRVIPAALEEGQASWSHGFLVFLVEIKSVEGPLGKLVATRRGAFEGGQEGTRAPGPASSPTGNPEKLLRAHQA